MHSIIVWLNVVIFTSSFYILLIYCFFQEGQRIDFMIDIESAVGLPKRFNVCYLQTFHSNSHVCICYWHTTNKKN